MTVCCRDTRQLVGVLTYMPGSSTLLHAVFLGAPKCARGTGAHLTDSITKVCDQFIEKSQYRGLSADGVYGHTHVPDMLDRHYGRRTIYVHDLMHRAALVDTHLRKDTKFEWLVNLTLTISLCVGFIQWGLEWDHFWRIFVKMVEEKLEARVLRPKTFSETKMANHAAAVYARFRAMLPAMVRTLTEVQAEFYTGGDSDQEKVLKANDLFGKIHTVTFLLSLSALVDIYGVFALISANFQTINLFAFDRKDKFDVFLHRLGEMKESVGTKSKGSPGLEDCACSTFFDYRVGKYAFFDIREGKFFEEVAEVGEEEEGEGGEGGEGDKEADGGVFKEVGEEQEQVEGVEKEVQEDPKCEEKKRRVKEAEEMMTEICDWPTLHGDIRTIKVTFKSRINKILITKWSHLGIFFWQINQFICSGESRVSWSEGGVHGS